MDIIPVTVPTSRGTVEYASVGDGPALLALHGVMGGWDQSLLLAQAVAPTRFRALALSRPGYLGTALALGRTPGEQADVYAATLDALKLDRAAVIAVSGGGPSAIQFALRHRDRCCALVLVSTLGEPSEQRLGLSFHLKMWLARRVWFAERMRRRMQSDPEAAAQRSIRDPDVRARTLADPEVGPLFQAMLARRSDRIQMRIEGTKQDMLIGCGPTPPLEQVRVATLVIHGTDDQVVPFRHGTVLARRIPGAEFLPIERGEHVAILTHRSLVRARVDAFLRAQIP